MKKRPHKILKWCAFIIVGASFLLFALDTLFPINTEIPFAHVVEARNGKVLHAYIAADQQWRIKTNLNEITPELKKAIIFKEDKYFYHHIGVNPVAIVRALCNNIFYHKRTSGASTITMQVSRMLDPKPRTYLNKCIEIFRALQLEMHYNKDEILQLYLNLVPYGSNIDGVKAASLLYFNKTPDQLSLAEITALSVIPNRPNTMQMGKNNALIIKERNKWLHMFMGKNLFPKAIINDALQEPLTAYRHNAAEEIPQLALRMKRNFPGKLEIRTTIDNEIQQKAENVVLNYVNQLKQHNINNASVLIVNNKTHEVIAYIGSSDFMDRYHHGQVDGVCALRSPGSTLKPLLYGLAFDSGLITPKTVIADVPINIKGYSPENYDRLFRGNVTAEDALRNSLNIPAVKLLNQIGLENFENKLSQAGFTSIAQNSKKIGLSVILGGCGIRLEELTALYGALANNGKYIPLKYIMTDSSFAVDRENKTVSSNKSVQGITVLSPSADYLVTKILCELRRPDLPNTYDEAQSIPRIAWKTGTSYGRKDAWSMGYNKDYTIGVWLGNFSGQGVPDLSGASVAAPLLFQLFNAVDYGDGGDWVEAPKELAFRLVCTETGKPASDFCEHQIMDYYLPGISSNEKCDHLKMVWLSANESYSYCTSCLPPSGYKTKWFPNISPELAAYYDANHIAYKKTPPHNPACSRTFEGKAPIITSLTNHTTYLIVNKEEQKLQLKCMASGDVKKVYWYINDKFFAATDASDKIFFKPDSPTIKICCVDDKGRNAVVEIKVKFI